MSDNTSTVPPFDESTCDRCDRPNPVWSTPVDVWQQVYGPGGQPTRQGVLCPSCFIDDAEAVGVTAPRGTAGWTVAPDARAEVDRLGEAIPDSRATTNSAGWPAEGNDDGCRLQLRRPLLARLLTVRPMRRAFAVLVRRVCPRGQHG